MATRTSKKTNTIFNKGNLVFLTQFGLRDQPEIILEVEDYNDAERVVTSSKIILIQKEVKKENDVISLIPLGNAFIFSSIRSDGENVMAGQTCFRIDNFDIFGIVENQEIIDIFNRSFVEAEMPKDETKTSAKKSKALMI